MGIRGDLHAIHQNSIATFSYDGAGNGFQSWELDQLGNWSTFDNQGAEQTRETNAANEITSITEGQTSTEPTYDAAGSLTFDGTQYYKYDAWNRLIEVSDGEDALATFSYDGCPSRKLHRAVRTCACRVK